MRSPILKATLKSTLKPTRTHCKTHSHMHNSTHCGHADRHRSGQSKNQTRYKPAPPSGTNYARNVEHAGIDEVREASRADYINLCRGGLGPNWSVDDDGGLCGKGFGIVGIEPASPAIRLDTSLVSAVELALIAILCFAAALMQKAARAAGISQR